MNPETPVAERRGPPTSAVGTAATLLPAQPRTAQQQARVRTLAAALAGGDLELIHAFGRDIGTQAGGQADVILSRVRSSELERMGGKLTEIVTAAQSINIGALASRRSSVPLLGPLIDRFRVRAGAIVRRFQDVRAQIDLLVREVDAMQAGLTARNESLEESFLSVRDEHEQLGIHIAAGEQAIIALGRRIEAMPQDPDDPIARQARSDLVAATHALAKRVADMKALQHAALQQLPMIRMVQTNNRMLVEKFHTIRELTVPAWKRQFMLALSLHEQKSAVELADSIDDATNQFLLENARLLKDNTIATARANQRLVIDVETLRKVHDSLVETVQEVIRINEDGVRARARLSQDLQQMRTAMANGQTVSSGGSPSRSRGHRAQPRIRG